jgi:lysophospholipase L1-like esterase
MISDAIGLPTELLLQFGKDAAAQYAQPVSLPQTPAYGPYQAPQAPTAPQGDYALQLTGAGDPSLAFRFVFSLAQVRDGTPIANGGATLTHAAVGMEIQANGSTYSLLGFRMSPMNMATKRAMFKDTGGKYVEFDFSYTGGNGTTPGLYNEWFVPHIDTGHWLITDPTHYQSSNILDKSMIERMAPALRSAVKNGLKCPALAQSFPESFPDSVVSSFAVDAHYATKEQAGSYGFKQFNSRIDGIHGALNATAAVGPYSKDWSRDPSKLQVCSWDPALTEGAVDITDTRLLAYDVSRLQSTYWRDTVIDIGDFPNFNNNPHLRFRPPWWPETSSTFKIACVGDSLTESFPCGPIPAPTPYPKLLGEYLTRVGITADVANYGISGAFVWRGSPSPPATPGALNYNYGITQRQRTGPYDNKGWYGASQGDLDLAIIWLGTNDAAVVSNAMGAGKGWEDLKKELMADFVTVMQHRRAKHYLLIKIDGMRYKNNVNNQLNVECRDNEGAVDLAACPLSGGAQSIEAAVRLVNDAILSLEQTYHNVHVAEVDYRNERCRGGESADRVPSPYYLHFGKNEGVAKSIFGRIMCHAVFNRPTGDLRWVGAIPNAKTSATRLPNFPDFV